MGKKGKDKKAMETSIDETVVEEALRSVEQREESKPEDKKKEEKEDSYDRLVRLTADFENFRKRVQKEKANLVLTANEQLLAELLPVLDNFERALEHGGEESQTESFRQGVQMIWVQLQQVLDGFGLKSESAVGKKFDPLLHEAVSHQPSEEFEADTVMQEHRKAYFLHRRLLRPAMVDVSKGPLTNLDQEGQTPDNKELREEE